jgi:hypothetical protein
MLGMQKGRLADAELGFDACYPIVQFDHFADERVKPDFQPVEPVIDAVESRVVAVESRVETIIKNGIHQDTDQYREGRYADCQI